MDYRQEVIIIELPRHYCKIPTFLLGASHREGFKLHLQMVATADSDWLLCALSWIS